MGSRLNQALSSSQIRKHGDNLFTERPCQGSKFHSPRPLLTSPFTVGKDVEVDLCGTCADNLSAYIVLAEGCELDWKLQREWGNNIRALGKQLLEYLKESEK